jgi:formate/nitrite transporter
MEARTPAEILAYTSDVGVVKAQRKIPAVLILSFFAGAFIAFAAEGSSMAAYNLLDKAETYGLGRVLAGGVFSLGLMMVLMAGAELFTGNTLIVVSVMDRKVTVSKMLLNWLLVYIGNFVGSLCIAWMVYETGQLSASGGLLGGVTIRIAAGKTALPFHSAFFSGILCKWLVCLAVWVSFGSKDIAGKVLTTFFIICLFVTSGFDHSVANMYYISAGIIAKVNPQWLELSRVSTENLAGRNWGNFLVRN